MQEASLLLKAESIDKSFPGVHAIDHVNLRLAYRPEISADVQPAGFPAEYPETVSSRVSRQSWARLIQKVYEIDPWSLLRKFLGSFGYAKTTPGMYKMRPCHESNFGS